MTPHVKCLTVDPFALRVIGSLQPGTGGWQLCSTHDRHNNNIKAIVSQLSRNRRLGVQLAAGKTLDEISAATPMIAEGVRNSLAVARLAKRRGVEMPITEQMVEILHHGKSPRQAVKDLMARELRAESEI